MADSPYVAVSEPIRLHGRSAVVVHFRDKSGPPYGRLGHDGGMNVLGSLTVEFERGSDVVAAVRLELADDMSPKALKDFAWRKWIAVAQAKARHEAALKELTDAMDIRTEPKHPGRRGRSPEFYANFAASWNALAADPNLPSRSPAKLLAAELNMNPSSIHRIYRKCVDLELLPEKRTR